MRELIVKFSLRGFFSAAKRISCYSFFQQINVSEDFQNYVHSKIMSSNHNNFGIFSHLRPSCAMSHFCRAAILDIIHFVCASTVGKKNDFHDFVMF